MERWDGSLLSIRSIKVFPALGGLSHKGIKICLEDRRQEEEHRGRNIIAAHINSNNNRGLRFAQAHGLVYFPPNN